MIKAGVRPDLLGEVYWWGTDDLWEFAFYDFTIYARASAERTRVPESAICARIAVRRGVEAPLPAAP